jgi:SAM-dependent methyltransferase
MDIKKENDIAIADVIERDPFELFRGSRETAAAQIERNIPRDLIPWILNVECGTGDTIVRLAQIWPKAFFNGLDISSMHLKICRDKLIRRGITATLKTGDIHHLGELARPEIFDLLVLHYVWGCCGVKSLLTGIKDIVRKGGYVSIVTATYTAFVKLQKLSASFIPPERLRSLRAIPPNPEAAIEDVRASGLEILEQNLFEQECTFKNFDELYDFGMNSDWLSSYFEAMSDEQLEAARKMTHLFPITDLFKAVVILARK